LGGSLFATTLYAMKIFIKILLILASIISGCSESENNYLTRIQADWKNSDGYSLSFQDSLYDTGWMFGGLDKFEIIGDTILFHHEYSGTFDSFVIRKLTEHYLWLRKLNDFSEDSLTIYKKIEQYSDNIEIERIEFRIVPEGCFPLGYRNYLIEGKNIYLQVHGRGTNDPNYWPVETGYYKGSIPDNIYQVILSKFRNIRYGELKTKYVGSGDHHYVNIQLRRLNDNEIRKIKIIGTYLPAEVRLLTSYIFKLFNHLSVEKINNAPKFELTPKPIPLDWPGDKIPHITSGSN
jgi:hypothetical protein